MQKKRLYLLLLIGVFIFFSHNLFSQKSSGLSVEASFFSENYTDFAYKAHSYFFYNGMHVGVDYSFFNWLTSSKKKPDKHGELEGIFRLNNSFFRYNYISNNWLVSSDLAIRKTFRFGLETELTAGYGFKRMKYLYPIYEKENDTYVANENYSIWKNYPLYGFSIGWDFEKNFSIPFSVYVRIMMFNDDLQYSKTASYLGIRYNINMVKVPTVVINKTKQKSE